MKRLLRRLSWGAAKELWMCNSYWEKRAYCEEPYWILWLIFVPIMGIACFYTPLHNRDMHNRLRELKIRMAKLKAPSHS